MKRAAVQLGISFACWTLLGVTYAVNEALYHLTLGAPAELVVELRSAVPDYWIWAALTPVIFALARRAPFTRRTWPRATLVHAAACGVFALLHDALAEWIHVPHAVPPGFHGRPVVLRLLSSLNNDLWMYGTVVIVASMVGYYRRYRERDVAAARLGEELARAELQALRNQLNPHLLFNALNSVAALMHEDVAAADDMLADLGHLLRAYLSGDVRQETTLGEELELIEAYVGIQKRRFADRLAFHMDVDPRLRAAAVPALLLQPLVENAILHGIAPGTRRGTVSVRAREDGGRLVLEVSDDGLGMAAAQDGTFALRPARSTPGEGIGLPNTRERLRHLYAGEQSFDLKSAPGEGVTVTITLPSRSVAASHGGLPDEGPNVDRGRRTAGAPADRVVPQGR